MKKKIASLFARVLALLCVVVTADASVYYSFDVNATGWDVGAGVIVSNGAPTHGAKSLYIPVNKSATNVAGEVMTNQVWTDFYTVPVRYSSSTGTTAPAADPSATAQFFVNSNGFWVTLSGAGCNLTNVCTQSLVDGFVYPTVTQYAAFYHVSVLHDYTAKKWSLFVNNVPLAENLDFIDTTATSNAWFQAQNLGGNATNACWLDDYLLTNSMVTTGTGTNTLTAVIPGTTLPVVDALLNFGSTADPRPTNKTVGVVGAGAIALGFGRVNADGRTYRVYGTVDQALGGLASNGLAAISSGSAYYTNSPLGGATNRYYYKLVTVSSNGAVATTNEETYAGYKQSRSANKYFIVGVPVEYANSSDRTMGGAMGEQLASGLSNTDEATLIDGATTYHYYRNAGVWTCDIGGDVTLTKVWPLGAGALVKRSAAGGSTSSYFAGLKATGSVSVAVADASWTYLSWPHNDKAFNNGSALGLSSTAGDYLYVQTNGAANLIAARYVGGTWKTYVTGAGPALSLTLQPGDGLIYKTTGGAKTFTSSGP